MILNKQKGKKIGIYGLGKTGTSAYYALKDVAKVICFDDSKETQVEFLKNHPNILLDLNNPEWQKLDKILVSPNIPLKLPVKHPIVEFAENYNIPLTSDLELLHLEFPDVPFIGITGTNGKSTTTSLIGHILNSVKDSSDENYQIGGNIGIACLALEPPQKKGGYILELSSYQIDLLNDFHLNIAILLNITPDHIERYGTFANYIAAKKKIFSLIKPYGFAIIAIDNEVTNKIYQDLIKDTHYFDLIPLSVKTTLENGIYIKIKDNQTFICDNFFNKGSELELPFNQYLQGTHNLENILCAFAAAKARIYETIGKSIGEATDSIIDSKIINSICSFQGLPHRMQFVDHLENIHFYNDSKATNAEAAEKSLSSLENIFWLAGGIPKEEGIKNLLYLKGKIKKAYIFGQAVKLFSDTLKDHIEFEICENLSEAFLKAVNDAEKYLSENIQNILLAPACASWDQFKNFEERGNKFIELVKNYTNLKKKE